MKKSELRKIPSVTVILKDKRIKAYQDRIRSEILKRVINTRLDQIRQNIEKGGEVPRLEQIVNTIEESLKSLLMPSLRSVVNATGVILHTNLGRAPLGDAILSEISGILTGYSNLEFDLQRGVRGSRNTHLARILNTVIGCEDSLVVNNNAAALFLTLKTLAEGQEVVISRGELVEIGGSFRIPDIIATSGAKLVEVGTTNRTRLSDYEKAVTDNTALFLKVHKSNYYMQGFTEEVSLHDLSVSAHKHDLRLVYDLGSGLLDRSFYKDMKDEPDVRSALVEGADIVTFSCDKILGGPQAGIAAGKGELIRKMARHPLMRVLRVDKITISALNAVLHGFLSQQAYLESLNPVVRYINRNPEELAELADLLKQKLDSRTVKATVIETKGQCGGGTMPYHTIESRGVLIEPKSAGKSSGKDFAETLFYRLLSLEIPVLGILREGNLIFDVLTLEKRDIETISQSVKQALKSI